MMTYRQIKRTMDILAGHKEDGENGYVMMWAEHDEHGIDYELSLLTDDEIIELAEMGWCWGCDDEGPDPDELDELFDFISHKVTDREKYIQLVRESDASGIYQIE